MKNIFDGCNVLITGASGFVGSHLAARLESMGANVYATIHLKNISVKGCIRIPCDLKDAQAVFDAVNISKPKFVFHLASQAIVNDAEGSSQNTFDTNVMGTVNLLENLRCIKGLHGVIVASTDKVYGRHEYLPYLENHTLRGNMQVYETSKLCQDNVAQLSAHNWGLNMGITRCGNIYGPGDVHWNRLIPGTIKSYFENFSPEIRSSGQFYRDYIYISDIVDAYISFMEFKFSSTNGLDILNFGSGQPCRVLDVVTMIGDCFGKIIPPVILNNADSEIKQQYVSGDKAMKLLAWKPKVKLQTGIFDTVEWYKEYFNGKSD